MCDKTRNILSLVEVHGTCGAELEICRTRGKLEIKHIPGIHFNDDLTLYSIFQTNLQNRVNLPFFKHFSLDES